MRTIFSAIMIAFLSIGAFAQANPRFDFSPDNSRLLTYEDASNELRVWDTSTGELIRLFKEDAVIQLASIVNTNEEVAVQTTSRIKLISIKSGEVIKSWDLKDVGKGLTMELLKNNTILCVNRDSKVILYDVINRKEVVDVNTEHHDHSKDGSLFFYLTEDYTAKILSLQTSPVEVVYSRENLRNNYFDLSPSGKKLIFGNEDRWEWTLWDMEVGEDFPIEINQNFADNDELVSSNYGFSKFQLNGLNLDYWNEKDEMVFSMALKEKKVGRHIQVDVSSDEKWMLLSNGDGKLELWDLAAKKLTYTYQNSYYFPWAVFSNDSRKICLYYPDGNIDIIKTGIKPEAVHINVPNNSNIYLKRFFPGLTVPVRAEFIESFKYTKDGRYILCDEGNGNIRIGDLEQKKWIRTISTDLPNLLFYVDDENRWIVTKSHEGSIDFRYWEFETGKEIRYGFLPQSVESASIFSFNYLEANVQLVELNPFSQDTIRVAELPFTQIRNIKSVSSSILAIFNYEDELFLWDVNKNDEIGRIRDLNLDGYGDSPFKVSLTGRYLAIYNFADLTLDVYDVQLNEKVISYGIPDVSTFEVAFSTNEKWMAFSYFDDMDRIVRVAVFDLLQRASNHIEIPVGNNSYSYLGNPIVFTPDNSSLIISIDGRVSFWSLSGERLSQEFDEIGAYKYNSGGSILKPLLNAGGSVVKFNSDFSEAIFEYGDRFEIVDFCPNHGTGCINWIVRHSEQAITISDSEHLNIIFSMDSLVDSRSWPYDQKFNANNPFASLPNCKYLVQWSSDLEFMAILNVAHQLEVWNIINKQLIFRSDKIYTGWPVIEFYNGMMLVGNDILLNLDTQRIVVDDCEEIRGYFGDWHLVLSFKNDVQIVSYLYNIRTDMKIPLFVPFGSISDNILRTGGMSIARINTDKNPLFLDLESATFIKAGKIKVSMKDFDWDQSYNSSDESDPYLNHYDRNNIIWKNYEFFYNAYTSLYRYSWWNDIHINDLFTISNVDYALVTGDLNPVDFNIKESWGFINLSADRLDFVSDHVVFVDTLSGHIITRDSELFLNIIDLKSQQLKLKLLFYGEGENVVIHPSGLFDATQAALDKLYFVQGLDVISLSQLKERYLEPGLWSKVMKNQELRSTVNFKSIDLPPDIELSEVDNKGYLTINLKNRGGGIGKVSVLINGKEVVADARPKGINTTADRVTIKVYVDNQKTLVKGVQNYIAVKAWNEGNWVVSKGSFVKYSPGGGTQNYQPAIHIVAVGISDYTGDDLDLKFAAKDAEDISRALQLGAKNLFGTDRSFVYNLTTNGGKENYPTKANILKIFDQVAIAAHPLDLIAVYLSGHGINQGGADGDWYYLTQDAYTQSSAAYNDPEVRKSTTLSSAELVELFKKVPASKQVLMIDACASGKVVENLMTKKDIESSTLRALDRMRDRTGLHIITGCAADAVSYEASKYGQGVLTYSLLEGIRGAALRDHQFVDVSSLFQYAHDRVPSLAQGIGGIQTPQVFSPVGGQSFDLGLLTIEDKASVPIAKIRPVYIRSTFLDDDQLEDQLELGKSIDEALNEIASKGAESKIIFVDVREYPEGCKLSGRYTQRDGMINLRLRRRCDGVDETKEFTASSVKEMVEKIIESIGM